MSLLRNATADLGSPSLPKRIVVEPMHSLPRLLDHIQAELKRPKSLNTVLQRKYSTFSLQEASGRSWKAQPVKYPRWEVSVVR